MITSNPTEEQFNAWLKIWQEYAPKLKPNRRKGIEVIRYIQKKYKVKEIRDQRASLDFAAAIYANGWMREKLPKGLDPDIHVFRILEEGPGVKLYEEQDEEFRFNGETSDIVLMVDQESGIYQVEGSSALWDELCCYQGLDADDIQNPVNVGLYVECMRKAGKMN